MYMAKLEGPLFSQSASGEIGKAIQFVCGHFSRAKPNYPMDSSSYQDDQRAKFLQGANIWSKELSENTKTNWRSFRETLLTSDRCVEMPFNTSGYNLWQLYFLKYGKDGWNNYPNPPA